ncbi:MULTISPECIES: DNA repair protein RecN [Bacillota]|jgi:DNA repair protein RecN (Recombination protein N)|uniref:DNA repair protein RecN n=3 Tax=Erysipelotrichaceae TaxID=128827 RepID=A0A7G9GMI1_9FIRM|nr:MULTISPECIES: DNA repair protein RecN [Bacillota]QNM12013.1 DNA repair protein RecN [[Eubacterium] hominis]MCH4286637.1 DNA repair protein RecN [Amedibacillus hominis]RGB53080.1 DNA repair protein RecN [Absiella sp. AM22-9]RGB59371.1 DNA repair protein RecN [Absiella sp. AM10-20]RGB66658.1 DNA repair protein RecN [Absiella sp. AM09-45]
MLQSIFVKNFVLIDEVSLEFQKGLSAFTGETGAGKSLLMDAIGVLKGDRANAGMVKKGCDKAIIEGAFLIEHEALIKQLEADGFDMEEGLLIITREITKEGKSTTRVNHRVSSVSYVKEIISRIVDIHSQHDTQYLLNARYHLSLLDNFVKEDALREEVYHTYHAYKKIKDELEAALSSDYNEDDLEYLTFQLNEIDQAELREEELDELETQLKRMQSFEKISEGVQIAIDKLEQEVHPGLYQAFKPLSTLPDDRLTKMSETLSDHYYQMEDMISELHDFMDQMEYDEEMFNTIQDRIFLIRKIYRKYGGDYSSVMKKREELDRKIDSILHRQDFIAKQETYLKKAEDTFLKAAHKLHDIRQLKANELSDLVVQQLKDLQLEHARFKIQFETMEGNAHGIDKVEFMISMNAGEALKPLSQTASGGELSRLMLGLKTVFTSLMGMETVIFDEIDTGVSGKVAFAIGRKMKQLSETAQVFCVTHLAPVAACANTHYMVEKHQDEETTHTNIVYLNEQERIMELANIASGSQSEHAISSAKELYETAQGHRE